MTQTPSPRRKRSWRKFILLGLAVVVLLWIALLVRDGVALRAEVLALQEFAQTLPHSIKPAQIDMSFVEQHLTALHENLSGLRLHAAPLLALAPALGWVPRFGGDIQAAPALLDLALQFTDMGQRAAQALAPAWPPTDDNRLSLEWAARAAQALQPIAPALRADLDRAAVIRSGLDLDRVSFRIRSAVQRFDEFYPALKSGATLLAVAPQLLGADRPRTYLILLQNEDELRATGGFISAVGRVTLDAGKIISLTVEDSYQLDDFTTPYPEPPAPLRDYMGLGLWVFRDSNWSPDFPTTAQQAMTSYLQTRGAHGGSIDGVIALNQRAVEELISGLGPLPVDPLQPPISASEVRAYMRNAWATRAPGDNTAAWFAKRKQFISQLLQAVLERVTNSSGRIQWAEMGQQVDRALRRRDVLIALNDPKFNQILHEAHFDGALRATNGDYVLVVDSNLGYNKANAALQESLTYTVTLEAAPRAAHAELTIVYTQTGEAITGCHHEVPSYSGQVTYDSLVQQCYWDYRRVYVPLGAQLSEASVHPTHPGELITGGVSDGTTQTTTENGKTVFSTLLVVPRGQRVESYLRYLLPQTVLQNHEAQMQYHLVWQKQSGAGDWPARVTVIWPGDLQLVTAQPQPIDLSAHAASFQFALDTDREVAITLKK